MLARLFLCTASFFVSTFAGTLQKTATPDEVHDRHAALSKHHRINHTTDECRFYSNATAPYLVHALPGDPFPVGELYSGSVPIDAEESSRELFFVFKPSTGDPVDEVTIWLNGGPGCSSLIGFLQENGPWLWQPGTEPAENAYSWAGVTNMLWIDQPVGVGFSTGEKKYPSEEDVAQEFVSFFRNWEDLFEIRNFKIYLTGESYAGRYVPYIASAMLDQNDTACFNLSGAMLYDPTIGQYTRDSWEVPIYPFVEANNEILNLNTSTMNTLAAFHEECGYADYLEKHLAFPPITAQPADLFNISTDPACDVQGATLAAIYDINPCFSVYNIAQQCPLLKNVLQSHSGYETSGRGSYFNRADVKRALHASMEVQWSECAPYTIFTGHNLGGGFGSGPEFNNDTSPDPIQHVLPRVIEATGRVLIGNGDWDFLFPTNGTLLAIQNMTWSGYQGFETRPSTPIVIDTPDLQYGRGGAQGTMGVQHFERGWMWAETFQCGHTQPQDQPRVALRHLLWLLGHVETV